MKISLSIAAHALALSLAVAFASAPRVAAPVPHHEETLIYVPAVVPSVPAPAVRVRSTQTAKVAIAETTVAQGAPARINLGHSVISPKLVLSATTETPSFGELSGPGQLTLPSTGHARAMAAPVAKLANFEQQTTTAVVHRAALVKPVASPVVMPTVTYMDKPAYTQAARAAGVSGTVDLLVTFHQDGTIRVGDVLKGLGYGLDEAAIAVAKSIRFRPATKDGVPTEFSTLMHINFQLSNQGGL